MTKKVLIVAIPIILVVAGVGVYALLRDDNKPSTSPSPVGVSPSTPPASPGSPPPTPNTTEPKKVCDILTLDDAKKSIGAAATPDDTNKDAPRDADHVIITTCTYNVKTGAEVTKSASLLLRVAKDAAGSANDQAQFTSQRPSTAQDVTGYGDKAYWDADFGQLHILKGTRWYVITTGSIIGAERKLDETKQVADLIKPKL